MKSEEIDIFVKGLTKIASSKMHVAELTQFRNISRIIELLVRIIFLYISAFFIVKYYLREKYRST